MSIKPLAIKVVAGIVGIGGASVIAHQGYQAFQSNTKQKEKVTNNTRLIAENYTPLTKDSKNDSAWTNILASYKEVIKEKKELAFGNFNGDDPVGTVAPKAVDILKDKCQEALNSENESLLNKVKKWCTVPTTIADALKGRRILKTDNEKDEEEDQTEWNEKIKNYTATGNTNKIANLTFTGGPITDNVTKENRNLIRGACKTLNEKKSYEGDYEEGIEKAKTWCSIEQ